jgi:Tol biopolymer transport system component/DNA-binding winged helix-turn-helix (wHTH) protein
MDSGFKVGDWLVQPEVGTLIKGETSVQLEPKVMEVLVYLARNPGKVLPKERIIQAVWTDTFVTDDALKYAIVELRKALEDDARDPRFIKTLPRRGYQLIAPVEIRGTPEVDKTLRSNHFRPQSDRRRFWLIGLVFTLIFISAALTMSIVYLHYLNTGGNTIALEFFPLTSYPGSETDPSFSPDGNQIVFSWNGESADNQDIWIKSLNSESMPYRLTTHPGIDRSPVWSPDGQWIAFLRGRTGLEGRPLASAGKVSVLLISSSGEPEKELIEIYESHCYGTCLSWTKDNRWLVIPDQIHPGGTTALFLLSIDTLEKVPLTNPPEETDGDLYPAISPDGETLAFARTSGFRFGDIYQLSLSEDLRPIGQEERLKTVAGQLWGLSWSADGDEIIYSAGFWPQAKLQKIKVNDPDNVTAIPSPGMETQHPAISRRQNRLAVTLVQVDFDIWQLEIPQPGEAANPPKKLIDSTLVDWLPQFLPDGRIHFGTNRTGTLEGWICEEDGSNQVRFSPGGQFSSASWSWDGEWIVFSTLNEKEFWDLFLVGAEPGDKPKKITSYPLTDPDPRWSRDNRWIYLDFKTSGKIQTWRIPVDVGESQPILEPGCYGAVESPDRQYLYYRRVGAIGLFRSLMDGGAEEQIIGEAGLLNWEVVENGIYYVAKVENLWAIKFLDTANGSVRIFARDEKNIGWGFSVSPDQRYILFDQESDLSSDLFLAENFR